MRIELGTEMVNMDGSTILDQIPSGQKNVMGQDILMDGGPLLMKKVIVNALVANYPDEQGLPGDEKFKRGMLALRIQKGDMEGYSIDEVALIKKLVGKAYGPVICTQVWLSFEGCTVK